MATTNGRPQLRYVSLLLALPMVVSCPAVLTAWGPASHKLVNQSAAQCVPSEARAFFESNRQFLADHANDPDERIKKDPYERARHYIYLDKYGVFPYVALPHPYKMAVARYGRRIGRDGSLPWQIGTSSLALTNAFKAKKWDDARLSAAVLGHFIADAHDPLHTTQNYNGQLSGAPGLEDRFGNQLAVRYSKFFMMPSQPAHKISDPTEHAFDMVIEANSWLNRVILTDRDARGNAEDCGDDYFDRFYTAIGSIAMRELNAAANDTCSYWYTAWLNAGSPELPH
jgi:hypothetical protein